MFKRRLGRSNLEVSALGLGCWAIGGAWTYVCMYVIQPEVTSLSNVREGQ
jgi:aryl-alcohol dehydrogenase-like predicted oxidoreductase